MHWNDRFIAAVLSLYTCGTVLFCTVIPFDSCFNLWLLTFYRSIDMNEQKNIKTNHTHTHFISGCYREESKINGMENDIEKNLYICIRLCAYIISECIVVFIRSMQSTDENIWNSRMIATRSGNSKVEWYNSYIYSNFNFWTQKNATLYFRWIFLCLFSRSFPLNATFFFCATNREPNSQVAQLSSIGIPNFQSAQKIIVCTFQLLKNLWCF